MFNFTAPRFDTVLPKNAANTADVVQADWEARQALPILMLLVTGGACAVMSQVGLGDGHGSPLGLVGFGVCAILALGRLKASH